MTHAPIILPPQPGFGDSIQAGLAPLLTMIQHRKQLDIERQRLLQEQQRINLLGEQVKQAGEMDAAQKKNIQSEIDKRTTDMENDQNEHAGANKAASIFYQLQGRGLQPGQASQPEANGEPGQSFDAAAIQEIAKDANKPYYGALVKNFHKLLDENVTNQGKIAEAGARTAQASLDMARAEGEKRTKALDAWKESKGKMTLGAALRSYGADTSSFVPEVLAQRSPADEGKFTNAGVSPSGNAVALDTKTGTYKESAQPIANKTGATAKATQEKLQFTAAQAISALMNSESRYRMSGGELADRVPWSADIAAGAASYTGKGTTGEQNARDAKTQFLTAPQKLFQSDMNQVAHTISGLMGGGVRSQYLYQSLMGTYNPGAGDNDVSRKGLRAKRQTLFRNLVRLKKGDMSALADIEGIPPDMVQEILHGGASTTEASPLDAGMAEDIK